MHDPVPSNGVRFGAALAQRVAVQPERGTIEQTNKQQNKQTNETREQTNKQTNKQVNKQTKDKENEQMAGGRSPRFGSLSGGILRGAMLHTGRASRCAPHADLRDACPVLHRPRQERKSVARLTTPARTRTRAHTRSGAQTRARAITQTRGHARTRARVHTDSRSGTRARARMLPRVARNVGQCPSRCIASCRKTCPFARVNAAAAAAMVALVHVACCKWCNGWCCRCSGSIIAMQPLGRAERRREGLPVPRKARHGRVLLFVQCVPPPICCGQCEDDRAVI
jgi:hypothetical protein